MRPILSAKEYGDLLLGLSKENINEAASAVANAAQESMERFGLARVTLLSGRPFRQIAQCATQLLARMGKAAEVADPSNDAFPNISHALVCDMLFSSGTDDDWTQKEETWIRSILDSGNPVLCVGIPAGVDPDTGRTVGLAFNAQITIAPFAYLSGLFLHDGLDHCGEIRSVGAEPETGGSLSRFEWADAKRLLPPRKRTAHKGDSGKALLCVGSPKYVGAALLSARACMAAGCGILYVACPNVVREALWQLPEAIGIPVGLDWDGESCQVAIRAMEGMRAVGLGCGVGSGVVSPLIEAVLRSKHPAVLDADGLNDLSRHPEMMSLLHEQVILTPHPGEMGRLTGLTVEKILEDPVGLAVQHANLWSCTVLLKGAATVVSDGKRTCIIAEGNAGLGKGGSGDVLTGIITALLAQGVEPYHAACLGSYLLGTSAGRAFALLKERMLRATSVIEALNEWNV